jgi:trk system potassium uptake protein TrkH
MAIGDRPAALGSRAARPRTARIDFRPIFFVIGYMLLVLAAAMIVPALVDAAEHHPDWQGFLASAAITAFTGGALVVTNRVERARLNRRQGFLLTTLSWIALSAFGGLPFLFSNLQFSFAGAFFETMSGLTTTGSTVLVGLDEAPPGILMWRALLQWIGGVGIIAMAVIMLPFLRVGGMQLFRTESSDRSEKVLPRPAEIITAICYTYLVLTVLCVAAYWAAGMTFFEALCHAMTTISTGGYSTSDDSIGHFKSAWIEWIAVVFMFSGAVPLIAFYRMVQGEPLALWRDSQVRVFFWIIVAASVAIGVWRWDQSPQPFFEALRHSAFSVVAIITTTGYAATDYNPWGGFATAAIFILTFIGGCTGSTAGGIKVFRLEVMGLVLRYLLRRQVQPRGVFPKLYNGEPVSDDVAMAVIAFSGLYVAAFALLAAALALYGLDFVTATTAAATAIGNVGPGLGDIIGPAGNFSSLPDGAKWLLSLGMLVGRLELFTVLVLFAPRFWRD